MKFQRLDTAIPGPCLIEPTVFGDARGFFMETFSVRDFAALGITTPFVQDNHSRSTQGVLRGLHYQLGRPQAKLVRVTAGTVFDVAVDVRRGSPTFGRHVAVELSDANRRMFYIPVGFAHGFVVTSPTAEFQYKCSDYYAPEEERGVIWNDPDLAIAWPLDGHTPQLSRKDAAYGTLATRPAADLPVYDGGAA